MLYLLVLLFVFLSLLLWLLVLLRLLGLDHSQLLELCVVGDLGEQFLLGELDFLLLFDLCSVCLDVVEIGDEEVYQLDFSQVLL